MRLPALLLALVLAAGPLAAQQVDFGADSGEFTNDGECDDPRFEGPGMTSTPLLAADILADASDCRAAWEAGRLSLRQGPPDGQRADGVNFGLDTGQYTNDGECDDPRFEGPGMTTTQLLVGDMFADASDCRAAWERGMLSLRGTAGPVTTPPMAEGVDFGDDASDYAFDGQCDDRRFDGPGMSQTILLFEDIGHDATDCREAWREGRLFLRQIIREPLVFQGIDFGIDSSRYANDGECDDPRFEGPGMTATPLLEEDIRADASDCAEAWQAGELRLRDAGGQGPASSGGKETERRAPRNE